MCTDLHRYGRGRGDDILVFRRGDGSDGTYVVGSLCCRWLNGGQKQNFLRDQSGMKKQLLTLQQLLAVMDPQLCRHLGVLANTEDSKQQRSQFCRESRWPQSVLLLPVRLSCLVRDYWLTGLSSWVLIAFKREFPFEDVLRLWEVSQALVRGLQMLMFASVPLD